MHLPVFDPIRMKEVGPESSAEDVIAWSMERFNERAVVMTTSFGMEGCALIDMYARHGRPMSIAYLDTMFFFPETYELIERMAERYPLFEFVNRGTTLAPEEQARQHGPELWKRDPTLCCKIRKVDPMYDVLKGADVWVTALRRSQSRTRAKLDIMAWDWQYQLLKLCPLVAWERAEVWDYIKKNNVPYNALHEQGYPTVGCTHCTQPVDGVKIGEYSRAGRWVGQDKTECGLHGDGI
jgi:phosphoadenosine phosphosulfate reductase